MSFESEIAAARGHISANELDAAMANLERAHVIGQQHVWPHVLSHWLMLRIELQRGRAAAAFGQLLRIALGALGSALDLVPTGNPGGSDIGMFKRMPIPSDLQAAIDAQPRNLLAGAAFLAWIAVGLMAVTMAWPDSQNLFRHKLYPVVIGGPLMLAALLLAILLSAPRLIPAYRVMVSTLLSVGILICSYFFVAAGASFFFVVVTGKILLGAKNK